jgi:hypothetical protein
MVSSQVFYMHATWFVDWGGKYLERMRGGGEGKGKSGKGKKSA